MCVPRHEFTRLGAVVKVAACLGRSRLSGLVGAGQLAGRPGLFPRSGSGARPAPFPQLKPLAVAVPGAAESVFTRSVSSRTGANRGRAGRGSWTPRCRRTAPSDPANPGPVRLDRQVPYGARLALKAVWWPVPHPVLRSPRRPAGGHGGLQVELS